MEKKDDISNLNESQFTTMDISNVVEFEFPTEGFNSQDNSTKKIGKCYVFWYLNGNPLIVIGPDCRVFIFRWIFYLCFMCSISNICIIISCIKPKFYCKIFLPFFLFPSYHYLSYNSYKKSRNSKYRKF